MRFSIGIGMVVIGSFFFVWGAIFNCLIDNPKDPSDRKVTCDASLAITICLYLIIGGLGIAFA